MQREVTEATGRAPGAAGDWFARMEEIGEEAGYFQRLGPHHSAFFLDEAPILLVTFESVQSIRQTQPGQLPMGYQIAKGRGWSHLCLIADGDTWYRDKAVYAYFDRLVDDAFFEDFDQVVFYGAGMAGYAAAAFSVAAPGATVIAVQPQATLDPRIAGWDPRWPEMRRVSFTDRYGFAPDMIEGAGQVFVIFDPELVLDAMHAALFTRPYVTLLPCRHLGRDIGAALDEMHILQSMLAAACSGAFDAHMFAIFYRARRNYRPYLRGLLTHLDRDGRAFLAALLCRNVMGRMEAPKMKARLEQLENDLKIMGQSLPSPRSER
ncbi:MAG TPA: phosphoadenosine phosphosulfate reductase [Albidovulum sp.]|uniref:phosphoadenosine phosphosulfate reductase n=1 Tax=Albidovulum sp. TaxID=1872424 RepID=UPI002CA6AF23|nr:phosphoadenosine phosphosulfate reductase [Albidovulum sp.]